MGYRLYDKYMRKKQKGFTLIELLVSISIIAILTALLAANFIGARQRGRDGQRKSNLYSLQSTLELYRADNGFYPTTTSLSNCGNAFQPGGSTGTRYMEKIPCDPSTDTAYKYVAEPSAPSACDNVGITCNTYTLYACLENTSDGEKVVDINSGCTTTFKLTNP